MGPLKEPWSSEVGDPGVRGLESALGVEARGPWSARLGDSSLRSSRFGAREFGCLEVWMFGSLELAIPYSTLDRDGSADYSLVIIIQPLRAFRRTCVLLWSLVFGV